jgi:hypothetical protein
VFFPAADTVAVATGGSERLRVDSSGNVGINTTSPLRTLDVAASGSSQIAVRSTSTGEVAVRLQNSTTGTGDGDGIYLGRTGSINYLWTYENEPWVFATNNTERARITSGGYLKASNNGAYANAGAAYHELKQSATNTNIALLTSSAASPYGPNIVFDSATPNNTTNYFLECGDPTNIKAVLYSNGSWQVRANSYGGISDLKLKQDIVDANSQWDDIKGLRIRKYRFKDEAAVDPDHPSHLGVIAQEAELVSPGLVFESPDFENVEVPVLDDDGKPVLNEGGTPQVETKREPTGTVTKGVKYSILYMKAVKALQEAMARIETLEAKVNALEAAQ